MKSQMTDLQKKSERSLKKKTEEMESEEREKTIWKIRRYLTSRKFGDYLTKELGIKYSQAQLRKLKGSSLKNTLHRIRVAVDMRNIDAIYDKMVFHTCFVTEQVMSPFYNIDGFAQNLQQNDEFSCALEKMKIEAELPNIPPPMQLLAIASQTAIVTHRLNQVKSNTIPESEIVRSIDKEAEEIKERVRTELAPGQTL